jgi:CRP/FNR family transcriptional regulator
MALPFDDLCDACPAFARLTSRLARSLGHDISPFALDAGQAWVVAGNDVRVPFVLDGRVQVALLLAEGRHVPLYTLDRGDWCALTVAAALGEAPRPLLATAETPASGVTLGGPALRSCLQASPVLAAAAFGAMAARITDLSGVVARLAETTVDQRLADALGTAREVVSRTLEHFAAEGLVRLGRAHIEVADPGRLAGHQARPVD